MSFSVTPPNRLHRFSVWQLVLGVVGLVMSLLSLFGILAISLISKTSSDMAGVNFHQLEIYCWILLFIALLTLPSIILSSRRLSGRSSEPGSVNGKELILASGLILVWVGFLWLGNHAETWGFPTILSSLLNIGIVALPILLWLALGRYKLFSGSKQRVWGIFNFSMLVTTQIIIVIEFIMLAVALILGIAALMQHAEYMPYFQLLQSQGQMSSQDLQALLTELTPLVNQPGFYALIALAFCVLVPMVEELFKPLAVWLFAGRDLTTSEGWTAGLLCGAAFGLVESLSTISVATGDAWLSTAVGRVGTGLLHILTAGLSGYALAKTWHDRKYLRLSGVYLGVIALHGIWNFFALLMSVSQMAVPINSTLLSSLMVASPWVLGGLAVLMASTILVINHHLRKQSVPPVLPGPQVNPEEQTTKSYLL